jgi:hypothetical protein
MFFSKKNIQKTIIPEYLHDRAGKISAVKMGEKIFRIAQYDLMMNVSGQKSIYLFDHLGNKVAWDIKSFEELDDMLRKNYNTPNG